MTDIISIDPGASGGIAYFADDKVAVYKMPDTPHDLFELLYAMSIPQPMVYVEDVSGTPGGLMATRKAVRAMWKFGFGVGIIHGVLAAMCLPYETVRPQKWQKALGCLTHGDKNVSKRRAQQLFPHLKVTHAVADALLIGEYARRTFSNERMPCESKAT